MQECINSHTGKFYSTLKSRSWRLDLNVLHSESFWKMWSLAMYYTMLVSFTFNSSPFTFNLWDFLFFGRLQETNFVQDLSLHSKVYKTERKDSFSTSLLLLNIHWCQRDFDSVKNEGFRFYFLDGIMFSLGY